MIKLTASSINLYLSSSLLFATHPFVMLGILMVQTLLICIMINLIHWTNWIIFMTFILIMGGMLVLFLYIVSLASNEMTLKKSLPSKKLLLLILLIPPLIQNMHTMKNMSEKTENLPTQQSMFEETTLFIKLFNHDNLTLMIFLMILLFLNLCIVTSLVSVQDGPLRSMN